MKQKETVYMSDFIFPLLFVVMAIMYVAHMHTCTKATKAEVELLRLKTAMAKVFIEDFIDNKDGSVEVKIIKP